MYGDGFGTCRGIETINARPMFLDNSMIPGLKDCYWNLIIQTNGKRRDRQIFNSLSVEQIQQYPYFLHFRTSSECIS